MIELDGVSIGYGAPLMDPLRFRVEKGDFWGIVGPNGGGKTTLVKTLVGIVPPVRGAVRFAGGAPPRFGYVPQRHEVASSFPLTAYDVALMGRYAAGITATDRQRVMQELERVDMGRWAEHRFDDLSGGQRQRVLLARALTVDPEVLVLDEPTTGMDLPGEASILALLRDLHAERAITVVMIGHHLSSVVTVVDHLCLINKDANVFEAGPMEEMLTAERLSAAYGRPIEVDRSHGEVHVHAPEVRHG